VKRPKGTATALCERVACPHCGASPGHRCKTPGGPLVRPGKWHRARIEAWALRCDDERRVRT
jgi:hypothetical protein